MLGSLKSIKSSGPDNIPARLLKEGAVEIAPSLTRRFNLSLLQASVPAAWKEAHVIPLHKKGDRSNVKNYRPVSLTSVVSKVLEKVLHFHLYKHLSTSDLLSNAQHGFCPGRSCESLLLDSVHDWAKTLHEKGTPDVIFLDISKAFDTVSHTNLLVKLRRVGIDGWVLSWIKSYLSNRWQRCTVDGSVSDWLPVTSGVHKVLSLAHYSF